MTRQSAYNTVTVACSEASKLGSRWPGGIERAIEAVCSILGNSHRCSRPSYDVIQFGPNIHLLLLFCFSFCRTIRAFSAKILLRNRLSIDLNGSLDCRNEVHSDAPGSRSIRRLWGNMPSSWHTQTIDALRLAWKALGARKTWWSL
jgi:hypothetical protein